MKKNQVLEQKLCFKLCAYFKPGKNETLACKGYVIVDQLMQSGKSITFENPLKKFDPVAAERLVEKMCATCDFHEHDCDFMENRTAQPCGGFVLLAHLLGSGALTIKEIP
jgi:hypothetical protein